MLAQSAEVSQGGDRLWKGTKEKGTEVSLAAGTFWSYPFSGKLEKGGDFWYWDR